MPGYREEQNASDYSIITTAWRYKSFAVITLSRVKLTTYCCRDSCHFTTLAQIEVIATFVTSTSENLMRLITMRLSH